MILNHLRRNVVAYLALTVALSTGTAYAAGLANGSVTNKKLAKNAVTSSKIKKKSVSASDLKTNAVTSGKVKNGSLSGSDLAGSSVTGSQVKNGSLTEADLEAGLLAGGVEISGGLEAGGTPALPPDIDNITPHVFGATAPGVAYVRWFVNRAHRQCTAGTAYAGLYLDGVPIPGTQVLMSPTAIALETAAMVPVTTGNHTVKAGVDCSTGDPTGGGDTFAEVWTVIVVPD